MGEQTGTQSHSALRIVAACQSSAEFVAAYSRYCEGRSLFIATKSPKSTGHIVKFKIDLASGEHLMTGVGPVVETFADRDNRFNRPGMRVEVEKLDASGRRWMEQLRARSGGGAGSPRVASAPTGMFATVSEDSVPSEPAAPAAAGAPVAPPVLPAAPALAVAPPVLPATADKAGAVPMAVADNLSAGWELDGLPDPVSLARPRAVSAPITSARSDKNGEKPAAKNGEKNADKNGEKKGEKPQAVVASGEVEVPPPLPPPPTKGRSKRITFPALMFNKPRGLATPPVGSVVPKPLALLPAAGGRESKGKLRPPTAPVEREPAAPVAPLGTPADTEPHVMVPPELSSSLAQPHEAAEGTPPPAAEPAADAHPDITDAPPEAPEPNAAAPEAPPPGKPRKRSKASTTTPPPVWTERTVTQTLQALIGGKPDPKVEEETVHWTNPGFAALTRPTPPQMDIVEEEAPDSSGAVPVVVGVEITADVMDKTIISPPPIALRRLRVVAAVTVLAAACLGGGYYLGLRQGLTIDKMPVGDLPPAAATPAAEQERWVVECSAPQEDTAAAVAPTPSDAPGAAGSQPPSDDAVAAVSEPSRSRAHATPPPPQAQPPSSPSSCYVNAMTSPVGATVLIDNKVGGRTPLRSKVSCGRHSVRFEMENYQAATRSFTVRRGETEKVSAELSRPRAVLRIESTPSGATVLINGSSVGLTPLTTTVPAFVSSNVTLTKPGYKTVARQINPTSTSARVGVTFKPVSSAARRSSSRR